MRVDVCDFSCVHVHGPIPRRKPALIFHNQSNQTFAINQPVPIHSSHVSDADVRDKAGECAKSLMVCACPAVSYIMSKLFDAMESENRWETRVRSCVQADMCVLVHAAETLQSMRLSNFKRAGP